MTHLVRVADNGLVFVDGEALSSHFTVKEQGVLRSILGRKSVTTKDMLLSDLYAGRDEPYLKIVDVFACRVRHKLGEHRGAIETVWGRGYMSSPEYTLEAAAPGGMVVEISAPVAKLLADVAFEAETAPNDLANDLLRDALAVHRARLWAA